MAKYISVELQRCHGVLDGFESDPLDVGLQEMPAMMGKMEEMVMRIRLPVGALDIAEEACAVGRTAK